MHRPLAINSAAATVISLSLPFMPPITASTGRERGNDHFFLGYAGPLGAGSHRAWRRPPVLIPADRADIWLAICASIISIDRCCVCSFCWAYTVCISLFLLWLSSYLSLSPASAILSHSCFFIASRVSYGLCVDDIMYVYLYFTLVYYMWWYSLVTFRLYAYFILYTRGS